MNRRHRTHIQEWTDGKHILITGASSGIGREIALRLVGCCRRLTLVARNTNNRLDEFVSELERMREQQRSYAEIRAHVSDVRDAVSASDLIRRIYEEEADQVDAFVNCAGGSHTFGLLETMTRDDVDQILDVNAKAPIYWLKELLPRMKFNEMRPGDLKRGHVLMLSSRSGERALPNLSVYAAAKGCVEKLVEAVRNEYASNRIAFTLVNPGSVNTAFTEQWPKQLREAHNAESMTVQEAVAPIIHALNTQFVLNKLSYESLDQWMGEPGVLAPRDV